MFRRVALYGETVSLTNPVAWQHSSNKSRLLRDRFGFYFSTIQIETKCLDEDHARELDISALLRLPLRG